jgi:hypothetical protein
LVGRLAGGVNGLVRFLACFRVWMGWVLFWILFPFSCGVGDFSYLPTVLTIGVGFGVSIPPSISFCIISHVPAVVIPSISLVASCLSLCLSLVICPVSL